MLFIDIDESQPTSASVTSNTNGVSFFASSTVVDDVKLAEVIRELAAIGTITTVRIQSSSRMKSLSPIMCFGMLEDLSVEPKCQIKTLEGIEDLAHLKRLQVGLSKRLDFSQITGMKVNHLGLENFTFKQLDFLPSCTNLTSLTVKLASAEVGDGRNLSFPPSLLDLVFLPSNFNVLALQPHNFRTVRLASCRNLSMIESLSCAHLTINGGGKFIFDSLASVANLKSVHLWRPKLSDIDFVSQTRTVEELTITGTASRIKKWDALKVNSSLRRLWLSPISNKRLIEVSKMRRGLMVCNGPACFEDGLQVPKSRWWDK